MEYNWKELGGATGIRIAVIGTLAILALFLFVETVSVSESLGTSPNPPTNTITVNGDGTATAIPDTATVSFGATATGADVATAQAKVTATINSALTSVKGAGIADADITTTSFNVSPHYTAPNCPPGVFCPNVRSTVSGYDVSENVSVKIHETSKVAAVLDGLAKANVSNVSGPDFVVGDTQMVQAQARGQAIQKAQQDAAKLASQLGVHLGKIVSFSDSSSGSNPRPMYGAKMMVATDASVAPTVPVGQNTYTDSVTITYQIR
jgi:uncharacterized protein YggE